MRHYFRYPFWLLFIISLVFFLFSACINNSPRHPSSQQLWISSTDCQMIEHDVGKTAICKQPQKIAALNPYILDIMLSLKVQPVAYAEIRALNLQKFDNPSEQIPYLGSRVTTQLVNLGDRKNPSLEKLTLLKPDLILGEAWGGNVGSYNLLTKISPTMLFDDTKGGWQRSIYPIAKALHQEANVQLVLTAYQQQIITARKELAPVLRTHPRVLIVNSSNLSSTISIPHVDNTTNKLLKAVGFELLPPNNIQSSSFSRISIETLPQLDPDIIIVQTFQPENHYNHPQLSLTQIQRQWNQTPVLQRMRASQEHHVYFVDAALWGSSIRGPIADEIILKQLPKLLLPSG